MLIKIKNGWKHWVIYAARLALASSLAIYAADLMKLQFSTQAGVICLFSMLTTKKDTLKLSLSRLISFVITAVAAYFLFQYVNEFVAYGIFIFITIYFSEMMGWGAALSANVVAGTHFLSVAEFTPHVILNEFFIVLTGMFFALIFNLFRDTNTQKDFLREEILAIQSKMQLIHRIRYRKPKNLGGPGAGPQKAGQLYPYGAGISGQSVRGRRRVLLPVF